MSKEIIVILIAVTIYFFNKIYFRWRLSLLKNEPDSSFVNNFQKKYSCCYYDDIIEVRKIVAKYFRVPAEKLAFDLKINELSKSCVLSPSYSLAISDIIYDLHEMDDSNKAIDIVLPETAGELIYIFLTSRNNIKK